MKKNYLSLRGGKTLHLEYDNGRDDNNSSAFTLLYSMYNLFFKSLSFLIVNAQTYILPKQEKRLYVIIWKSRDCLTSLFLTISPYQNKVIFFLGLLDSLIFLKKSALQILLISKSYMKNYLVTL